MGMRVKSTGSSCPLPKPELPSPDWRAYFERVYGDRQVPVSVDDVNVLNLTLLATVSAAAASYAAELRANFPREHPWGPCFDNACGSKHFAPFINVHCPLDFAWRLQVHDNHRRMPARKALPDGSWAEVTHCGGSDWELSAAYFYAARGSGLWINVGRTMTFGFRDHAVTFFLGRNCTGRRRRNHGLECDEDLDEMAREAARRGYDSVQFLRHCDAKCEQCLHELVVLRRAGFPACPSITYRRGSAAGLGCKCVERSHSVGTPDRPFRGGCAACETSGTGLVGGAEARLKQEPVVQTQKGPGQLVFLVKEVHAFESDDQSRYFSIVEPHPQFRWSNSSDEVWLLARSGFDVHMFSSLARCDSHLVCAEPMTITLAGLDDENLAHNAAVWFGSPDNGTKTRGSEVLLVGGRFSRHGRPFTIDPAITGSGKLPGPDRAVQRAFMQNRGVLLYTAQSLDQLVAAQWNRSLILDEAKLRGAQCVERRAFFKNVCEFDGRFSLVWHRRRWLLYGRANIAATMSRTGTFGGRHVQVSGAPSLHGPWSQFRLLQIEDHPISPVDPARNLYFAAVKSNPAKPDTLLGLFAYYRDGDDTASVRIALSCDGTRWTRMEPIALTSNVGLGRGDLHPVDGWLVRNDTVHFYVHRGVPGAVQHKQSGKLPSVIERASVSMELLMAYTEEVLQSVMQDGRCLT